MNTTYRIASFVVLGFVLLSFSEMCFSQQDINRRQSESTVRSTQIRTKLNRIVDLKYDDLLFGQVRKQLEKELGVNVVIDPNLEGVLDDETEVSADLKQIRLADGLRLVLRFLDSTYVVKDGVILIISIDDELEPDYLTLQTFDVRNLLKLIAENEPNRLGMKVGIRGNVLIGRVAEKKEKVAPFGSSGPRVNISNMVEPKQRVENVLKSVEPAITPEFLLVDAITSTVSPDAWEFSGIDHCTIRCVGGVLAVRASEKLSEKVQSFLIDLESRLQTKKD